MEIGEKIKHKRIKERMSAQDLAIKLSLKKENIYKWESGSKPSDPEEFARVSAWLNNSESVPHETVPAIQIQPNTDRLLEMMVELMKTQNHILQGSVKGIEINLDKTQTGVDTIQMEVSSAHEVMLRSLARLEKKDQNILLKEASSIILKKFGTSNKKGKRSSADR